MKLIKFLEEVGKLKGIKRTGWVREGVPGAESVADHSFRVAFMAMVLAKKNLDMKKLLKMALLHDMGEVVTKDRVWIRGNKPDHDARKAKEEAEMSAVKDLCKEIKDGESYVKLFKEYEEKKSEEAKFLNQIDKLEMALQAYSYEKEHGKDLGEFYQSAGLLIKNKELLEMFNKIVAMRKR